MKRLVAIAALTAAFAGAAKAQQNFEPGYIVTLKGDTVKGEVKHNAKKEVDLYTKVMFKDANGAMKNYKPGKIKSFGVGKDNFISTTFENEPAFMKVVTVGAITLYEIQYEMILMNKLTQKMDYFVQTKGSDEMVRLKPGKFKKQLAELMKENEDMTSELEQDKDSELEKVPEFIHRYNDWVLSNK